MIRTYFTQNREFIKTLFSLALPIALQNLISSLLNMVDTVMIGQLGATAIAAVGLANQVFFLFNLLLFGVNSGAAIYIAQFWGKRDIASIHKVQGLSLTTSLAAGLVFTLAASLAPEALLRLFSTDPAVISMGSDYLRIIAPSYLLTAVSFTYASTLRSTEKAVLPMVISFIALGINTCFNYCLIYGNWGFPKLGVAGAAIATALARSVELSVILAVVYARQLVPAADLQSLFNFSKAFTRRFFQTVIPVILNEFFWALGITMFAVVYARMGTGVIAAVNISSTIERLALVLFFGMASACAVIIGNRIGAGDEATAFLYAKRLAWLTPLIGSVITVILLALAPWFLIFYQVDPEVLALTRQILTIFALVLPAKVFNLILVVGILRSGGDTKFCLVIDTAALWFIAVPLAFLGGLVWRIPPQWVYLLAAGEEVFKLCLGIYRLISKKWLNNLTHHVTESSTTNV